MEIPQNLPAKRKVRIDGEGTDDIICFSRFSFLEHYNCVRAPVREIRVKEQPLKAQGVNNPFGRPQRFFYGIGICVLR